MSDNVKKSRKERKKEEEKALFEEQKALSFLSKRWRDIAMLVALIVLWILTGISIWYSVLFLAFFWATAAMAGKPSSYAFLARIMKVIFLLAIVNFGVNVFFPRIAEKKAATISFVDQQVSSLIPSNVDVKARDIFEQEKKLAFDKFTPYYQSLVNQGRTQEAIDTLRAFNEHWSFFEKNSTNRSLKREEKKLKKELDNKKQVSDVNQLSHTQAIKDSIFYPGTYYIDVVGQTPFNIVISNNSSGSYSMSPTDGSYDYKLWFVDEGGPAIQASSALKLKHRDRPKFRLIAKNERVKLVIT